MTEQSEHSSGSVLERADISALGALASLATVLIITVIAPPLVFDAWTPRIAVVLLVGPLGLWLLVAMSTSRDAAAALMLAFIGWMALSGLISDGPRAALVGTVGRDLSTLTVACSAGFWAVGRFLTPRDRQVLGVSFVGAASFAALIAVLQVAVQVDTGPLRLLDGRPPGTLTNPVYLGAIASGAAIEAVRLAEGSRWRPHLLASTGLLGGAVSLSGSRVAAGATILVLVGWVVYRRQNRVALVGAACVVAGMMAGVALDRLAGAQNNVADRLAGVGGSAGRTTAWRYGWSALWDRPVIGHGMGRYRAAVQGRFSPEFVRDFAQDDLSQAWFDPHNALINLLVTVGLVGTVLFVVWLVLIAKSMDVAAVFVVLPLVLHVMLQPVSLFVMPVVFVFLGSASSAPPTVGASRLQQGVLLGIGASCALGVVVADSVLSSAIDNGDGDRAASVAEASFGDPVVSDIAAQLVAGTFGEGDLDAAIRWQERATESEPDRPYWWTRLALSRFASADFEGAELAVAEAHRLQPYNVRAWEMEALLARNDGDQARFAAATDVLCRLGIAAACDAALGEE